jgi:hypothetical protein
LASETSGGYVGEVTNPSYTISPPNPGSAFNWDNTNSAVPADRQSFISPFGRPSTAGAAAANYYGFTVVPNSYLDPQAAYDFHVWTASQGTGSMQAIRRIEQASFQTLQTLPAVPTQTPASGLQHTVFNFNGFTGFAGQFTTGYLTNVTNTSILYSKFVNPSAKGITITDWGYGGHGAYDLYYDKYMNSASTPEGRAAILSAMTDGNSGKLMVTIEEGTNDAAPALASVPSVHGILPGNSSAAFKDNVESLIDAVKSDWSVAGKSPADLSFLVLGMYDYGHRTAAELADHIAFSGQLHDLAQTRSDVSFIDLHDIAPSWDQASALGYMADDVHATVLGADVYSNAIFDQLTSVPEPSALMLLGIAFFINPRRRKR